MNILTRTVTVLILSFATAMSFAEQAGTPATTQSQPKASTPAEFDEQVAKMQEQMGRMQEQMAKIQQTQDPQERQKLLQDHWDSMQSTMAMMHQAWGGMGCCGMRGNMMGGHMMGGDHMTDGHMMWGNYQNLTPEELKQRQYMMDRWMPMQQMMMDQMLQHQQWMMQPSPSATPK